jgi:hypothetical protein
LTDGGVEGDTGGRGDVESRRGGGRNGATLKRTGSQTKEAGKVHVELGRDGRRMGRNIDVFRADGVTTKQGDRSCQLRGAERTVEEREEERGHEMGRRGGCPEGLNSNIIVNVGDLVLGVIIPGRCRCRGGQGRVAAAGTGSGSSLDLEGRDR